VNPARGPRVSPRMRATFAVLSAILLLALTAVGPASAQARTTVETRQGPLGTYLADGHGNTLYRFMKDKTRTSRCSGACAQFWPPLIARHGVRAGAGVKAAKLSTSRRANGKRQVVYAGHPLYRYTGDAAPGDTTGEGLNAFGGRWWLVSPAGRKIVMGAASPSPSPTPDPYGY
jgi:predicted lipoprotein with Yx(FWY)xxD motif